MNTFGKLKQVYQTMYPILISSLVGVISILINTGIIGNADSSLLYILGLYLPVSFLLMALNESFRTSAIAFSAEAAGKGDVSMAGNRLKVLIITSCSVFALLALAVWLGGDLFTQLYGVAESKRQLTINFLMANSLVAILIAASTMMMSTLYGWGKRFLVTTVSLCGSFTNIVLTYVLANYFEQGLFSLIYATLCTASITFVIALGAAFREGLFNRLLFRVSGFMRHVNSIRYISVPVFMGYVILFVHLFFFNQLLSLFNESAVAGFSVAHRIQNLVMMPAIATGIALGITVNRLRGEGAFGQIASYVKVTVFSGFAVYLVLATVTFFSKDFLVALISPEQALQISATQYLSYFAPAYLILGPLLTLLIYMEQTGKGIRALVFNAVSFSLQLGAGYYVALRYNNLDYVYMAVLASYLVSLAFIIYETNRTGKKARVQPQTLQQAEAGSLAN